jgi:hypothetical protein
MIMTIRKHEKPPPKVQNRGLQQAKHEQLVAIRQQMHYLRYTYLHSDLSKLHCDVIRLPHKISEVISNER